MTAKSFYEKQTKEDLIKICVDYAKQIKKDHDLFKVIRSHIRLIKSDIKCIDRLEEIISNRGLNNGRSFL